MNTATKVQAEKGAHPDKFCAHPRCLWRIKHRDGRVTPCPKHGIKLTIPEES